MLCLGTCTPFCDPNVSSGLGACPAGSSCQELLDGGSNPKGYGMCQ